MGESGRDWRETEIDGGEWERLEGDRSEMDVGVGDTEGKHGWMDVWMKKWMLGTEGWMDIFDFHFCSMKDKLLKKKLRQCGSNWMWISIISEDC